MSNDRARVPKKALAAVLALAACAGCSGEPSLDELNAAFAVPGRGVDPPRDPDAPFAPGERIDLGDADGRFEHDDWENGEGQQWFGDVIAPGDLDGDGVDDLLVVGTEESDNEIVSCDDECPGFSRVVVHVFYGDPSIERGADLQSAAQILSWHLHGMDYRVRAAGDLDADGRDDILVGVSTDDCEQGNAFVVYGGPRLSGRLDVREVGAMVREAGDCSGFGAVAGLGDVDADGHDDFAVGAPMPAPGRLYLYPGAAERPADRLDEGDAEATLEGATDHAVYADAAGDVDGDGHDDFFVASVRYADAPDAPLLPEETSDLWLVPGAALSEWDPTDLAAVGVRLPDETRRAVGLGDLDGDGRDDFAAIVAHPEDEGERVDHEVLVFLGREAIAAVAREDAAAWVTLEGPTELGLISREPALAAGDFDGDGRRDLLLGDPSYHDAEERLGDRDLPVQRGLVYLLRGAEGAWSGALALDAATAFVGQAWLSEHDGGGSVRGEDLAGSFVAAPDLNGDGLDDLVLGAPAAANGGRVYLWLGR